jgi:DNA-binding response OmpR family regulator
MSGGEPGLPRVVVIDDDEPIRHLVAVVLRGIADVDQASTAAEGLALIGDQPPRLVILDARLPDGAGVDVARRIRALPSAAGTPIVMVSGDPGAAHNADVDGYLRKPFDIEELRSCVQAYLA